jgi:hypothetical protein
MGIQERITINCKRGGSIDVPFYMIRPWRLQKGTSNTSVSEPKIVLAYMVQIKSTNSEGDVSELTAASVEVEPAEYKRIVDLKRRVMAEVKI